MHWSATLRSWLPAFGAAIPNIIIPIAVLSIPLAAAQEMRLSEAETTSWIVAVYGLPGLLGLVLAIRYRQPLLLTGNIFVLLVGVLAGIAADLPEIIPLPLLLALAGLAVIGVLANALQQITRGPLLLGPLFAFAIALSKISILGFDAFFWALVIGTGISLLLERDEVQTLRSSVSG